MFGVSTHKSLIEYSVGKLTICGNYLELKKYSKPIYKGKRLHVITKDKNNNNVKRDSNLFRARASVRNIIYANLTPHTKLITLTTADICLDEKVFKRRLTTFLQAMKREGYKLRYLGVLERQKERGKKEGNIGSVHVHLVTFNDEYIPFELISKHWYGIFDIKILDGLRYKDKEKIVNVAAYVCKYITKEACDEWGSHSYFCSKGLNRPYSIPEIIYIDKDSDSDSAALLSTLNPDNHEVIQSIVGNSKSVYSSMNEYKFKNQLRGDSFYISKECFIKDERVGD